MGLLGDIFNGFTNAMGREMERRAGIAHKAAQSGSFNGRRLNEQGKEKMRIAESRYRDAANRAQNFKMNNKED